MNSRSSNNTPAASVQAGPYEAPEVQELGDVSELTLGRRHGDSPDGRPNRFALRRVTDELEELV